ncbi:ABC transporter substrate-binding protein [Actinocorallia populi]|uniref:ABC transporter substrate-binding protein n=1 Tax=Actinocorallia populi TaxID=2079200 RepID=UPI000D090AF6|nr:ABC transporter substrate-binding protein [Actinocorallia populi]
MTGRRPLSLLLAVSCAALITACGGGPSDETGPAAPPPRGFPVTVENCGMTTTYERPPRRAVTMNQHVTEVLLALGLEKSMAGTAFLDDAVLPEYEAAYKGIKVVADEYPSYETLLSAEPDFVYGGFTSAFDEKEGRSRERLADAGIDTRLDIEACPSGPVTMETLDREIRDVAEVFGVPERGEEQLERLHGILDAVAEKLDGVEPVKVFVYDSGDKTAFTAGGAGIGNEMIELAGGVNLFADVDKSFADVSFEQVAERAPEVVVIYDYGDQSVEDKKRFLLASPALRNVPAIKDERFAVLPLSSAVLGVRAPAGVESLARQIHPDRFR